MKTINHNTPVLRSLAVVMLTCVVLFSSFNVSAERGSSWRNTFSDSYIGVGLRGGLAGMTISGDLKTTTHPGFTYGLDLCYMGEMGRFYGFIVGISYVETNFSLEASDVKSEFDGILRYGSYGYGDAFELEAHYVGTTSSVREVMKANIVEIPVLFTFARDNFYLGAGVKFAIPFNMSSRYTVGETSKIIDRVYTTGTLLDDDLALDAGTVQGFDGRYTIFGSNGKMVPVAVMAAVEVGYRMHFGINNSLQFSLYGEFPLGSLSLNNATTDMLVTLDEEELKYRGIANAGSITGLNYFKYGLRVQYNFGLGKAPRSGHPLHIW
ncbi:MAG: hypothetical protein IJR13_01295 [Bacteroidales bacterium]|nr:hypothetical protein [Bacteroidales bacterium]